MPQGSTTIDFGAFPGKTDVKVSITGQTAILAGSLVEAWVMPVATTEHSADEQWVDKPEVIALNVVASTGFDIQAIAKNNLLYGRYNIGWVWN